jgi:hypothetical protein
MAAKLLVPIPPGEILDEEFMKSMGVSIGIYSEDQLVEQPAIALFADLGWQVVSAMEEVFGPSGAPGAFVGEIGGAPRGMQPEGSACYSSRTTCGRSAYVRSHHA